MRFEACQLGRKRISNGPLSKLLFPWAVVRSDVLPLSSWNSRALLHFDAVKRKKKLNKLLSIAKRGGVIAVQEVHGF